MSSSIDTIKQLREETGLSFNQIQSALKDANGDKLAALEILKQKGAQIAHKKAERVTQEGVIDAYVHSTRKVAALVQLLCETDFVARNPEFTNLAHEISMHVAAMDPADEVELLEQPYIKDPSLTIRDLIHQAVSKLGENIKLAGFVRFAI